MYSGNSKLAEIRHHVNDQLTGHFAELAVIGKAATHCGLYKMLQETGNTNNSEKKMQAGNICLGPLSIWLNQQNLQVQLHP